MCFERLALHALIGCGLFLRPAPLEIHTPLPEAAPSVAVGKIFLTIDEALELAFPECKVKRQTVYLGKAHKKRVAALAGTDFDTGIVHPYVAKKAGKLVGTAYFDTHKVRSLRETLMFVVSPKNTITRVELLAFGEPLEYAPRPKWYAQFVGRELDKDLKLRRGIRNVTGATLSARAATGSAREALATHKVLLEIEREREAKKKKKKNGKKKKPPEEPAGR